VPVKVQVLIAETPGSPTPYIYRKQIGDVLVSIVVGLNTGSGFDDTNEEVEDFERNRSAATAGWTIFCNDRAVIVGDKSRLTGWGDGLPMYHGQFSVITGIVEFTAKSADSLPITTTKRALDTASEVWPEARAEMRDALRVWINYTNKWKNHPRSNQTEYWAQAKPVQIEAAVKKLESLPATSKADGALVYNPAKKGNLPNPPDNVPSSRKLVFSKPTDEIQKVSFYLFDRGDEKPGVIGDACFDVVFREAKKGED
jgi:hypothetical protein